MRILVVQESDWIARGPHQSHHLMERLSKRGHEIRVIDFEILWRKRGKGGLFSERQVFNNVHKAIEDASITVIRPPIIRMPVLDYISLIYTHRNEVIRQINEFNPDVIIGFGILNANIAINQAKKNGIPFVYYIIDELHHLVPEKAFQAPAKLIESQNMKKADKVISINEGLREYTIRMGAPKKNTEVIRAGVDLERFRCYGRDMVRNSYDILDSDIILFFMGWLYDFSGLKEVALEIAQRKIDNIKLLVVGRGDLWETLQEIRIAYSLEEKLIIVDWVPYDDIPTYLSASDICILPAYRNDVMRNIVPIKMYEYMAAGKPIIATRNYGLQREFGDNSGIIYVDNPKSIPRIAKELMNSKKYIEEGIKARKFAENCGWDGITERFILCLNELF